MIADILAAPAAARAARATFAAENLRENVVGPGVIAEIGKAGVIGVGRPATLIGKIPVVLLARPLGTGSVDFAAVKARALVRIAQQIVGGGDFLELIFGTLVAGIEVRV